MAPQRKVLYKQLEILVDYLDVNRELINGLSGSSTPHIRAKWAKITKRLNAVPGGMYRTPERWRKYWVGWRHRLTKKAKDNRRCLPNNKCTPFNNIEIKVIELSEKQASSHQDSKSHQSESVGNIEEADIEQCDTNIFINSDTIRSEGESKGECYDDPPLSSVILNSEESMEALETGISFWEDALAAFSMGARGGVSGTLALTSPEEAEFCREIQDLLQEAYSLQERCELLFLDQRSVLFRSESDGGAGTIVGSGGGLVRRERLLSAQTGSEHTHQEHHSSAESFASAEDQIADLEEFDDLGESLPELENLELYQTATKHLELGIPYRTLRTDVVHCSSDSEFLCKLHCLRLAFHHVFRDAANWAWFVDAGRQVLTDLIIYADKEPKEFLVAYEEMVSWVSDGANWPKIENELSSKGVKMMSFYDVVLDYILLDAFEDLAAPPSSVLAVARNRWLSDGFKETALATAVWSVIKAKRSYLQYPDGFMSHFYSISEHLLPVLVWGFLGPREKLREVCHTFRAQVVGFITDLFDFQKCRYTTVEDLATDILQHARTRAANITDKLSERI